jgi:hypothetical protein
LQQVQGGPFSVWHYHSPGPGKEGGPRPSEMRGHPGPVIRDTPAALFAGFTRIRKHRREPPGRRCPGPSWARKRRWGSDSGGDGEPSPQGRPPGPDRPGNGPCSARSGARTGLQDDRRESAWGHAQKCRFQPQKGPKNGMIKNVMPPTGHRGRRQCPVSGMVFGKKCVV